MIRIQNIKLSAAVDQTPALEQEICRQLRLKTNKVPAYRIVKKSIDARKKESIFCLYTVDVSGISGEGQLVKKLRKDNIRLQEPEVYPEPVPGEEVLAYRPVVIGAGPAGLFAAYTLALQGYRPILLERGADVDTRTEDVTNFWKTGRLNTASNVQFGEGGAGTFSDGKVNSGISDPRCNRVLETFVRFGAAEEIRYFAKPHIGTDVLKQVVKNMRLAIIAAGGDVRFHAQVTNLRMAEGKLTGLEINGEEWLDANCAVLAIGHSARDTFAMLHENRLAMERKAFAVGVRIEHSQEQINLAQYGMAKPYDHMGAADYKLTYQTQAGRSVYSFCMCPGGHVVAAASEEGRLAVNGMSYRARDGRNANAALVVNVKPEDFDGDDVMAGVEFQRRLEEKAFLPGQRAGKPFHAPVQLLGDFLAHKESRAFGTVLPTYEPGTVFADMHDLFPTYITEALEEALPAFGRRISGYDHPDAVLTAVESRTSSPVRIVRGKDLRSVSLEGLYPCGEGAGYAGGIMSAGVDGIRVAEAIISRYRVPEEA